MDFDVNVQAKVTGLNDVEKLDNHIDNLKTYSPITIDVKSNVDSNLKQLISGSFVNNVKSTGNRIGQNLGQGINNGIKSSIKNIKIDPNKAISTSSLKNKKIAYRTKVNNTIDGTMAELQKLANNNHWKDFKVTGIESANGEIQKLTVTYTEATGAIKQFNMERQKLLTDSGNTPNGLMQVGDVKVIKTATTAVKELNAEIQKVQKKETNVSNNLNNVKTSFATNDFKSKYGGTAIYQQLEQNIKRAEEAQAKLNAEIQKGDQADFDKINSELKEMSSSAQKAKTQMERLQRPISDFDATTASNKTLGWLKENTKASKEFGTQLKNIASLQSKATTWGELDDLSRQFKDITTQAKQMGLTGLGALGEAKRAFLRIAEFTGMYGVIQNVVQEVPRKMANAVLEVNTATTELKKVSTATASEIDLYFEKATKSAKKYGATINEVINSTADWSRLGYNLKDASIMSDATTLLQVVGDNMTQESSSAGLISILKGFQLQADDANAIVDKINEVANTQPIDTSGIVNALQRSASSLSAANNTLDESIAMITAANSVVQDPDSVGKCLADIKSGYIG